MSENTLAITGVTGKSGAVFAKNLAAHADEVHTMFPGGVRLLLHRRSADGLLGAVAPVEEMYGELADEAFLRKALAGVDTLVHISGIGQSELIMRVAAESGVRRAILVHTTGIYSKYKAAGENYRRIDAAVTALCKEHGIALTILRPTMIYGTVSDQNVVKFIKMVDRLPVMPVVNDARYALQPVHYADLGDAYYAALTHEAAANHNYNLSGGEEILLRDMLSEIGRQLGKNVKFFSVPFPIAYAGAWGVYLLTLGRADYREKVQRLCEPRVYPHDEATRDFGYAPRRFAEGVADEIKEYKAL